MISGMDDEIKELMKEERMVKSEWKDGKEKETKLENIRLKISKNIAENIEMEMEKKVEQITTARYLQAEIFKIRRNMKKIENMDFPLKDKDGNVRVSKEGIDEVISTYFKQVWAESSERRMGRILGLCTESL